MTSASADGGPRVPPQGETLRFIRQVRTGTVHIAAWAPEEPWHASWVEPDAVQDWGQAMAEWVTSPGQPMLVGGDGFNDENLCIPCVRALGGQQWRAFHVDNRGPFNQNG